MSVWSGRYRERPFGLRRSAPNAKKTTFPRNLTRSEPWLVVFIVAEKGLTQITDNSEIEAAVEQVINGNPDQAQQFKEGNHKVAGWFVGQVMKATQGKANPQIVNELLRKKLG